jgi:hypothetical protein
MPRCPDKITSVPVANLFSFNFPINMSGTDIINIKYSTKPIVLSTKPFNYDILKMNTNNNGINDPKSKHWPKTVTWKTKNVTKKIKILGQKYEIKIPIPTPTQAYYEIYTLKKSAQLKFFTIPAFKFEIDSSLNWQGNISCSFTLSCEFVGACLLEATSAQLIDIFYNDGKQILQIQDPTIRTNRIINMLGNPNFLLYGSATTLLTYLLRDGLTAAFTVLKASGKLNWTLNSFYIEFGDLKIKIPKFQISLDFPDILKDPVTGQEHPVTVSGNPEDGLVITVQLLSIPNADFFGLMLTSLQNTLNIAKSASGTPSYDDAYVNELETILAKLQNGDDQVTKWIQQYLGISFTIVISFVFCPSGMSSVPPSPFFLRIEVDLNINPYKILDDFFKGAEIIENTLSEFENEFLDSVENIKGTAFAHPIEKMLQGALNTANKELQSATQSAQKMIDNKYLNKVYKPAFSVNIPIEPPP